MLDQTPGFRRYSSFRQSFQETVGESVDRSLSPSPPLTEHSFTHSPFRPPIPHAHHPLAVVTSICYPTPCSLYVVFFRTTVAYFLPL